MPHIHLAEELGPLDGVSDLLWRDDVVLGHLGSLVERPGMYIHPYVAILLLRQGDVEDAVYGRPGVHILYDPVLPELLEVSAEAFMVVVRDCKAWWLYWLKPVLISSR